ncbi:potassium/sodium hyperpolarization-activated cyclic nucleotide-gated channel 1-like [Wyeomyia smithii]|uniref:potassium/sodium hyperpolarization-activated cyclic nucleotide-gated channel 1-like n=1 Tax=Wyeomyia smithii TaxID=174621 RepID=UPI002467B253|nr:potassium/sodium hyperpolarization-activated cyclic nucleotide-gated channel 1-like [Wyeomyia smithii]
MCYLDQTSPLSREVFRSDTAMKREISRHISFYASTIHPFSYIRFCWESIMIVTFALAFIVLPYDVVYLYHPDEYDVLSWFHVLVLCVDFICLIDICFNIRTGYYEKDRQYVELSAGKIAHRYLRFWFWIDLISSAPDPLFSHYIVPKQALHHAFIECLSKREFHFGCFWDSWKVLSVMKIFRLPTFLRYISNVFKRFRIRRNVFKFTTIATIIVLSFHWMSCMMFLVPRFAQGTDPELVDPQSWTVKDDLWDQEPIYRYYETLARTVYLLGMVTHSIDFFMTNEDVVMDMLAIVIGYVLKIYILAELIIFIRIMFSSTTKYHEQHHELQNYIRHEQLPASLEKQLFQYYDYRVADLYSRKAMIDQVTGAQFFFAIRKDVAGPLIADVTLFRDTLSAGVIHKLLAALRYQIFLKDDLVVNAARGSKFADMVFVIRGTVAIYTSAWREVLHLEDGEHFGEYQLVLDDPDIKYSNIVAVETSEVYVLDKSVFNEILSQHPILQEQIATLARERYDALVALEKNLVLKTIEETETIRRTRKFYQ